jgi:hypothetical protein
MVMGGPSFDDYCVKAMRERHFVKSTRLSS